MFSKLDELGVKITPYTWLKEISENGAICFNVFSGREWFVEASNIVMVTTKYSNIDLFELLASKDIECHLIGDALAPRWILNATHDGYKVAVDI
jgi:hypothetical protein